MDKKHQEIRDDKDEEKQGRNRVKEEEAAAPAEEQTSSSGNAAAASPPSASSSPSHEFSFTISLHQPSAKATPDRTKSPPPPSFAVDLTPADEIFFHGHLLPLHLLSHLPVSPRSSTNSLESFTLPIKELLEDQSSSQQNPGSQTDNHDHQKNSNNDQRTERKPKPSRSFSLFWLPKWRKGYEVRDKEEKEKHWRKLKFDITQVVKRYMRMVRPLLSFRPSRRSGNLQFDRQAYSYSGHLNLRRKKDIRGKRGEYSAPASMRTSPTNSGLLVPPATSPTSSSDSTMEELQAAIQAAIAHCKKSIQVEDKLKCQD